jgi:HAD superfamily hydrolase (TIGR01549 family)
MRSLVFRSLASSLATMSRATSRPVLRGVIFDLDGTLTQPNLDFKEMYRRCGVDMSEDLLKAIQAMPESEAVAAQGVIDEMEKEAMMTMTLMPSAIDLAQWLHAHKIPMALVTRNTAQTVKHLDEKLWTPAGLPPLAPVISRDDVALPAKPDPAALAHIAQSWQVPLGPELLMVGDSPSNDVGFGKGAGVSTALLDTGRRTVEGGDSGGADLIVDSLGRLPHAIWGHFELEGPVAGPLAKYETPSPQSTASTAAAAGDVTALSALPLSELAAVDPESGNTPLVWAADAGHVSAIELLLNSGVDVNHRGYLGATATCRACRRGHTAALAALLAAPGCDPNLANDKLQSPLHFAAFKLHPDAVRLMLEQKGCNPFVLDRKGRTPAEDTSDELIRAAIRNAQERAIGRAP